MKNRKSYFRLYWQYLSKVFLISLFSLPVFFKPLSTHAEYGTFLQYIKVDFFQCDDATWSKKDKKIYLELNENSSVDLCYQVTNTYSEPLDVKVNFVDGWLSNGSRVCHSAAKKDLFGQYVQPNSEALSLWAGESQKVTSKLSFPVWYVGQVMWCLMYNVVDKQAWWMFDVVVGRTRFIDVFVKGDLIIDLEMNKPEDEWDISKNKQLHVKKMPNDEVVVSLQLNNKGNVAQDVLLKWEIRPLFGKPIEFTPQIKYVQGKGNTVVAFSAALPRYKWKFDISLSADYTPNFLFDSEQITPDMRKTQSVSFSTSIFVFPWWVVAALLVLVGLWRTIVLLIRRHRRKRQAMMQQMQQMYQNMYAHQYWVAQPQPWMYPGWFLPNAASQIPQQVSAPQAFVSQNTGVGQVAMQPPSTPSGIPTPIQTTQATDPTANSVAGQTAAPLYQSPWNPLTIAWENWVSTPAPNTPIPS